MYIYIYIYIYIVCVYAHTYIYIYIYIYLYIHHATSAPQRSTYGRRNIGCWSNSLLYSTLLYSTLLYSTLLYSTLLYSTLLYSPRVNIGITSWSPGEATSSIDSVSLIGWSNIPFNNLHSNVHWKLKYITTRAADKSSRFCVFSET